MGSLHWSESDLRKITTRTPKTKSATIKTTDDTLKAIINSIKQAKPEGFIVSGERVEIQWAGMRLLTLNEMLRIDHRMLHAYRHACHDAVRGAVLDLARKNYGLLFQRPIKVQIHRTGKRLVDTDGLYASFKFIIDGFRLAGVIRDDDPLTIVEMTHSQTKGNPLIGISITLQN